MRNFQRSKNRIDWLIEIVQESTKDIQTFGDFLPQKLPSKISSSQRSELCYSLENLQVVLSNLSNLVNQLLKKVKKLREMLEKLEN